MNEIRVERHAGWRKLVVNRPDKLNAANAPMLTSLLAAQPTEALAMMKRMFAASASNGLDAQLDLERDCQLVAGHSADYAEGVRAFLEKRPPVFRGRA